MACASKQCGRETRLPWGAPSGEAPLPYRGPPPVQRPPSRTEAPLPYICKSVSPLLPQVNENACARSGPLRSISQVPATRWSSTIQPSTSKKGGTSTPRLRRWRVSLAKKPSTALSQDAEVGVKWKVQRE